MENSYSTTALIAVFLLAQRFYIPERNRILEDLICELDQEGIIDTDWIEIY